MSTRRRHCMLPLRTRVKLPSEWHYHRDQHCGCGPGILQGKGQDLNSIPPCVHGCMAQHMIECPSQGLDRSPVKTRKAFEEGGRMSTRVGPCQSWLPVPSISHGFSRTSQWLTSHTSHLERRSQ